MHRQNRKASKTPSGSRATDSPSAISRSPAPPVSYQEESTIVEEQSLLRDTNQAVEYPGLAGPAPSQRNWLGRNLSGCLQHSNQTFPWAEPYTAEPVKMPLAAYPGAIVEPDRHPNYHSQQRQSDLYNKGPEAMENRDQVAGTSLGRLQDLSEAETNHYFPSNRTVLTPLNAENRLKSITCSSVTFSGAATVSDSEMIDTTEPNEARQAPPDIEMLLQLRSQRYTWDDISAMYNERFDESFSAESLKQKLYRFRKSHRLWDEGDDENLWKAYDEYLNERDEVLSRKKMYKMDKARRWPAHVIAERISHLMVQRNSAGGLRGCPESLVGAKPQQPFEEDIGLQVIKSGKRSWQKVLVQRRYLTTSPATHRSSPPAAPATQRMSRDAAKVNHAPPKYCAVCGRLISPHVREFEQRKHCSKSCRSTRLDEVDREMEALFVKLAVQEGSVECGKVQRLLAERIASASEPIDQSQSQNKQQKGMEEAAFRERVRRAGRRVVAQGRDGMRFECVSHGKVAEASFAKGEWAVRHVKQ